VTYLIGIDDSPRPIPPTRYRLPEGQRFFHLVPSNAPPEALEYSVVADGVRKRIEQPKSGSIELKPSPCHDNLVLPGRIYFTTEPSMPSFEPAKHAYDRLVRYLGKWQKTEPFGARVGPATAEATRAGSVELRMAERDPPLALADRKRA
jgi:hypothetical protein